MKQENVYRNLIDQALAIPKREPREYPPSLPPVKKLVRNLTKQRTLRKDAESVYAFIASVSNGSTTLEDRVPISELHAHMSKHLMNLIASAVAQKAMPFRIHCHDNFLSFVDLGFGRVLRISVQLHPVAKPPTQSSFIVEESNLDEIDLSMFDRVQSIPYTEADRQGLRIK